jgi:anti-sigma B factor antagonist
LSVAVGSTPLLPRCWFRTTLTGGVLSLAGELDMAGVPALQDALAEAEETLGGRSLTVDLGELEFMDCTGLSALVAAAERASARGTRLEVAPGAGAPARVLRLCGLDGMLTFREPTARALRARA